MVARISSVKSDYDAKSDCEKKRRDEKLVERNVTLVVTVEFVPNATVPVLNTSANKANFFATCLLFGPHYFQEKVLGS